MIRRILLVSSIGLALLAGPLAAVCATCCPELQEQTTVVTAGCCDCGQTLERPAAPDASLSGRAAAPETALGITLSNVRFAAAGTVPSWLPARRFVFSPFSPPTPQRL